MVVKCLPIKEASKLKEAIKSGKLNANKFLSMSPEDIKAELAKYVDTNLADFINLEFEKAVVSKTQNALGNWLNEATTGNKNKQQGLLFTLKNLDKNNQLSQAIDGKITAKLAIKKGNDGKETNINGNVTKVDKIDNGFNVSYDINNVDGVKKGNTAFTLNKDGNYESKTYIDGIKYEHSNNLVNIIMSPTKTSSSSFNKINNLKRKLADNDYFYQDLINSELGVKLTKDEFAKITALSDNAQKSLENIRVNNYNLIDNPKEVLEFFKSQQDVVDYMNSRLPTGAWEATMKSGKLSMLASISSPLYNIYGNTMMALEYKIPSLFNKGIKRKLKVSDSKLTRKKIGVEVGYNIDLKTKYHENVYDIYKKTGFDISRMDSIADFQKLLGEKTSNTKGGVTFFGADVPVLSKSVAGYYGTMEKYVGQYALGRPDVISASRAFANTADILSYKMAKQEGLKGEEAIARAREIFIDATNVSPQTEEGIEVRNFAKEDAKVFTFTNDTWASNAVKWLKDFLNKVPFINLGDMVIVFSKVPPNAFLNLMDFTGTTAGINIGSLFNAYKESDPVKIRNAYRHIALNVTGIGASLALALLFSALKNLDYIPPFEEMQTPAQKALIKAKKGIPNSIRLGDAYVSLDFFAPFSVAIASILMAKKGVNFQDGLLKYGQAALLSFKTMAGYKEMSNIFSASDKITNKTDNTKTLGSIENFVIDSVMSRIIPNILNNIAQAFDPLQRDLYAYKTTDNILKDNLTGQMARLQSKIPFWRQGLTPKMDVFGFDKKNNGLFNIVLGSRISFADSNDVVNEINRLSQNNHLPNLSDIRYSNEKLKMLKSMLGEKEYTDLIKSIGNSFYDTMDKAIKTETYKNNFNNFRKQEYFNKQINKSIEKGLRSNPTIRAIVQKYDFQKKIDKRLKRMEKD